MTKQVLIVVALAVTAAGCGQTTERGTQAHKNPGPRRGLNDPAAQGAGQAVAKFLTAISGHDESQIFALLTEEARTGLRAKGISPQLPSSGTTSFEVGEIESVEGGAHVMSQWRETADDGTQETTEVLWMLRQEKAGWRIAGMALRVFENSPAVILNFEDPDEMIRKLDLIAEEEERRSEEAQADQVARETGAATTR